MEVSSHALDQGRVDGVRFHSAAFTNLTRDHLDYHPSMQAYGEAKARLFAGRDLQHRDHQHRRRLRPRAGAALRGPAPLDRGLDRRRGAGRLAGSLAACGARSSLDLSGVSHVDSSGSFGAPRVCTRACSGRFNAENSLVVLGCLLALGVPLADAAAAALAECTAPPGRMEVIESEAPGKPLAVVDYAHTPDALAKALSALREHCRGELWCVFGCGGDRDPGKRPMMGAVADELADRIIVTDDNPRSEDPAGHHPRHRSRGIKSRTPRGSIHDRGAAIAAALNEAAAADVVLIAGKGHEDYQIYGATRRSFSDRLEALQRRWEPAA